MRDVIVIGAGGGGPVVAAELAGRGLDVLVLEGGPRQADPSTEWSHAENDANNPNNGFLRFGPEDRSKPAWFREWTTNMFVWQLSGVGGTTQHYYGNSPRPMPGVFRGYTGADAAEYDTGHLFPFTYDELVPYLEWVEATLPIETAAMGTKEALTFRGWLQVRQFEVEDGLADLDAAIQLAPEATAPYTPGSARSRLRSARQSPPSARESARSLTTLPGS